MGGDEKGEGRKCKRREGRQGGGCIWPTQKFCRGAPYALGQSVVGRPCVDGLALRDDGDVLATS